MSLWLLRDGFMCRRAQLASQCAVASQCVCVWVCVCVWGGGGGGGGGCRAHVHVRHVRVAMGRLTRGAWPPVIADERQPEVLLKIGAFPLFTLPNLSWWRGAKLRDTALRRQVGAVHILKNNTAYCKSHAESAGAE